MDKYQQEINEITLWVYNNVPEYLKSVLDDVVDTSRDFKVVVANKKAVDHILELNEGMVTDIAELDDPTSLANETANYLNEITAEVIRLGSATTQTATKKASAALISELYKRASRLQEIAVLTDESVVGWLDECVVIGGVTKDHTPFTAAADLWASYGKYCDREYKSNGIFPNTKKFAKMLRSLGLVPGVTDINDKTTRVYYGVTLKKQGE